MSDNKNSETLEFQTETKKLLDLMIHSLYQNKEIFLRELVSNASDAIDKRHFESLTNHEIGLPEDEYAIVIDANEKEMTLTISDNGIGMNKEDLIANLGTIAKSGTQEFITKLQDNKDSKATPELIGQFGVGFYSSFMVSDRVVVVTRKAGDDAAYRWESKGDGTFTISDSEKDAAGTEIKMYLNKKNDDSDDDYTSDWLIRSAIKKYSDFIAYPIKLVVPVEPADDAKDEKDKKNEGETKKPQDEQKTRLETLNAQKTIWSRNPKNVTEDEYTEFYKHISRDWEAPAKVIHFSAEGLLDYQVLLFIPKQAPFDLFLPEKRHGINLYAKKIFIMDDCKELIPDYLRFVKGVVDCADISLNISRESVQQNRQISQIRSRLIKKILDTMNDMKNDDLETYTEVWGHFGKVIKEGLYGDAENKDRLKELVLFNTSTNPDTLSSFSDYVSRMKTGQDSIYYLTGESIKNLQNSPHLESLAKKEYEVIFFTDAVDEFVLQNIADYDDKTLKSAGKGELDVTEDDDQKKALEEKAEKHASLLEFLKDKLDEHIKEVRVTSRLTSSAACLVTDENMMAAHVEKMLRQNDQSIPKQKRILEINPDHELIEKMQSMFDTDRANRKLTDFAELLYGQAALMEGIDLPNPHKFASIISSLMSDAVIQAPADAS
ncbi:MAG: molecular chaperone HtpG [Candidatus Lindowbacteria bacterium]|nr:molecular chaperone HtpG [Candidatus Lindowbacteria bacterium]